MKHRVLTFPGINELGRASAEIFVQASKKAISERGIFSVALSGGETPRSLFQALAHDFNSEVAWESVHFFWSDERNVPEEDPANNYRLARETLLDYIPALSQQVHRIPTSPHKNASEVAEEHERDLAAFFSSHPQENGRMDLLILGLGEDGHTASLMKDAEPDPFDPERGFSRCMALYVPHLESWRLSWSPGFINQGRELVFMVSGERKSRILRAVLEPPQRGKTYPAQLIKPESGILTWLIDRAAGQRLLEPREKKSA